MVKIGYNKHINIKNIYSKKLLYTYESLIKNINERKNIKKTVIFTGDNNITYKINKPIYLDKKKTSLLVNLML